MAIAILNKISSHCVFFKYLRNNYHPHHCCHWLFGERLARMDEQLL